MTKEKVVLLVLSILSVLLLALSIGSVIQIKELRTRVDEQEPTQMQRYFNSVLDEMLFNNKVQFIELGTTETDTIEKWSYSTYVVELTEMTMVEVIITFKDNLLERYDDLVDLNIYYGGVTNPDVVYEELSKTTTYTLALQKGFNSIELDSYSSSSWEYSITIKPKK